MRPVVGNLHDRIRSFFTDSFELEGSNWCKDIREEFQKRRGYDLYTYYPLILKKVGPYGNEIKTPYGARIEPDVMERIYRMRYDYELTLAELFKERFLDEEEFNRVKDSFVLDPSKLRTAKSDMIVLHPLPRVNEITRAVDNDPRAAYFRQVENGKFVRMALIYTLLKWAEGEKLAAVPDLAEGMFIDRSMKCPNSRCISATEDVDPLFVKAGDTCRCAYCEAKIR